MKKIILSSLLLLIATGCAAKKTPEQIAEEQAAWDRYYAAVSKVRVTKQDPIGCKYIGGETAKSGRWGRPGKYDDAVQNLKEIAYDKGANFAVIDNLSPSQNLIQSTTGKAKFDFEIMARLFKCP